MGRDRLTLERAGRIVEVTSALERFGRRLGRLVTVFGLDGVTRARGWGARGWGAGFAAVVLGRGGGLGGFGAEAISIAACWAIGVICCCQ